MHDGRRMSVSSFVSWADNDGLEVSPSGQASLEGRRSMLVSDAVILFCELQEDVRWVHTLRDVGEASEVIIFTRAVELEKEMGDVGETDSRVDVGRTVEERSRFQE